MKIKTSWDWSLEFRRWNIHFHIFRYRIPIVDGLFNGISKSQKQPKYLSKGQIPPPWGVNPHALELQTKLDVIAYLSLGWGALADRPEDGLFLYAKLLGFDVDEGAKLPGFVIPIKRSLHSFRGRKV